jgi:DNA-binding NtrC family response regulator
MSDLPKVLIVDDEPEVLAALRDLLRRDAEVLATSDPAEARRLIDTTDLALVLADQRMPGTSGTELLSYAAHAQPASMRVLLTGFSDIAAVVSAVNDGRITAYVTKPWSADHLHGLVAQAAEHQRLREERTRLLGELGHSVGQPSTPPPRTTSAEATLREENAVLRSAAEQVGLALRSLQEIGDVLPICSVCSRVKTGSARWEDVADVLHRIPAFLSHGYCPECAARTQTAARAEMAAFKAKT